MTDALPDVLARIVEQKRCELSELSSRRRRLEMEAEKRSSGRRDFFGALKRRSPAVIAEIKQASPSRGRLTEHFQPVELARAYERGGAAALSVLTDEQFFQGSLEHLEQARSAVALPVLRKDFTLDEVHVIEAAAHGADAVLLIAALHDARSLRALRELAESFGMAALVEVHDERELEQALQSGARIVGVNNRDLRTFHVKLETSVRLAERMPPGLIRVSESGIDSAEGARLLVQAGYHALLVGEHLMRAADPAAAVAELAAGGNACGNH